MARTVKKAPKAAPKKAVQSKANPPKTKAAQGKSAPKAVAPKAAASKGTGQAKPTQVVAAARPAKPAERKAEATQAASKTAASRAAVSKPAASKAAVSKPAVSKPAVSKPVAAKAAASKTVAARPAPVPPVEAAPPAPPRPSKPIPPVGDLTGQLAPNFTLPNQDGAEVSLSDFRGQWLVLYFYPKDDTPGCTAEACEFNAGIAEFRGLDAQVVGCSPDRPDSHRKFIEKFKLKFQLLSDTSLVTMKRYGAYGDKTLYGKPVTGVIRTTVLIDPLGFIAKHWPTVKAAGHAAVVRATLDELRST